MPEWSKGEHLRCSGYASWVRTPLQTFFIVKYPLYFSYSFPLFPTHFHQPPYIPILYYFTVYLRIWYCFGIWVSQYIQIAHNSKKKLKSKYRLFSNTVAPRFIITTAPKRTPWLPPIPFRFLGTRTWWRTWKASFANMLNFTHYSRRLKFGSRECPKHKKRWSTWRIHWMYWTPWSQRYRLT